MSLRSPIAVWMLLVLLTLLSYGSWAEGALTGRSIAGSAVIIIAFLKARLIGLHFMELNEAVVPLRIAFEIWALVTGAVLVGTFWIGG